LYTQELLDQVTAIVEEYRGGRANAAGQ
jgi:hypothetical protein